MTRKNYNDMADKFAWRLAEILKGEYDSKDVAATVFWDCVVDYCRHAKDDNNLFDESRFMDTVRRWAEGY